MRNLQPLRYHMRENARFSLRINALLQLAKVWQFVQGFLWQMFCGERSQVRGLADLIREHGFRIATNRHRTGSLTL